MKKLCGAIVIFITLTMVLPVFAVEFSDKFQIHGFGSWGYGQTDGNTFLIGKEDGKYDNFQFSLALSANPSRDLKISAQAYWEEYEDEDKNGIDYAFAEWFFDELLSLRIGKVKQPIGLFNEVYDVGTVREFYYLPQSIYGPSGIFNEAYKGLGLTGLIYNSSGWGLEYDLYGGEIDLKIAINYHLPLIMKLAQLATAMQSPQGSSSSNQTSELYDLPVLLSGEAKVKDVVGGRVNIMTPFSLKLGGSAYIGDFESAFSVAGPEEASEAFGLEYDFDEEWVNFGVHLEFRHKYMTVCSEVFHGYFGDNLDGDAGYLSIAINILKNWQIAARYDRQKNTYYIKGLDTVTIPKIDEHEEISFGINYWFNHNFVLKASYHLIDGNMYALPATIDEVIEEGIDEETNLFVFGAQFSF